MKRGLPLWYVTFVLGVGVAAGACGGSTEPADAPAPAADETAAAPEQAPAEPEADPGGRGVDVGMEFGGDEEEEAPTRDHEPPPTSTWQPTQKEELTDKKADTEKK